MIKKINIFLVLLVLFISVSAVSAAADGDNVTEIADDKTIQDTLTVSEDISYSSESVATDNEVRSHTVNVSNYLQYFDSKGNLVSSDVNSGDTINLNDSFSETKFVFNKQVNVVGNPSLTMNEVTFTFSSGASGSTITNLNIQNSKDETYGIFLNSASNCIIQGCNIVNTGRSSYCICVANNANHNNVTDNYLKAYGITYGHGSFTRSTPPLIVSGAHYNYIANNHVEADDANGIYLSSYSGGPLNGGISNFNTIYNNTVHYNVLPTSWAYGIQVMGNNNTVSRNTVIGAYRGISTSVSTANGGGNIIIGNKIINLTGADYNHPGIESGGEYGIVASLDTYVANNTIVGAKIISTGAGISAIDKSIVENNLVDVTLKGRGIVAGGYNVIIRDNVVYTQSGSGIYEKDEGSGLLVDSNNITSDTGVGILIEKLSSKRMPKNVTIINNIISTNNEYAIDASGVQADTSFIDLKSNKAIGKGVKINSPAGVIDSSKPTYIFNGNTITITPENIREYINDNGGLTSKVNDSDILSFEGAFSNEVIYVTKSVKITGKNPIFYNSTFKVTSGGVLIENLTIINSEAERVNAWGIFTNQAPGVRIMNNRISVSDPKAAYAIYVLESTDVDVWNNTLSSEGDFLTFTILSYASEGCNFANNTIKTVGTGNSYQFSPEKCIDGNELVINGRSYCLDGNELVIDGVSYCLDGNELVIDGTAYCLDGNELVIDGTTYCLDGNEFVIDGTSYCLDGEELSIDGVKYNLTSNVVEINGRTYCLDGEEVIIDGKSYCLDGNELVIDGTSYCLDGNELVIDGTRYCVDGNEYTVAGAHVVSEIYQTYGILLLYSSNNLISGNDVNVTSKLQDQQSTIGNKSSQNSLVGIDLYFNCHNNTVSNNNVFVKGKDNYLYGVGVLGYFTGHTAPKGQGATNNSFIANTITVEGSYCAEGVIIGDESEDTYVEDNVLNIISGSDVYGIYFEMSQSSIVNNNILTLNSQVIYGIIGYDSSNNKINNNRINANSKFAYAIIISNGNDNSIIGNVIDSNVNGEEITFINLDSLGYGNAGIYLKANSTNNVVESNEVTVTKDYAVLIDDESIDNVISDNYLDSEMGIGNYAVNSSGENTISGNYKYIAEATVQSSNVLYLGSGEFIVKFKQDVDGGVVKFYDVNGDLLNETTVLNGAATLNYNFDDEYIPATYLFKAVFSRDTFKTSAFDINFKINKGNAIVNLEDITLHQGETGDIVATILDTFGNPIKNAFVEFGRFNSAGRLITIGNATTDEKGIATFSYDVPVTLDVTLHNISAKVTALDYYNGAENISKLNVLKRLDVTITTKSSTYVGDVFATLTDSDGNKVANKKVSVKIGSTTYQITTNSKGELVLPAKIKKGTYQVNIVSSALGKYEAQSSSMKLVVSNPITGGKDYSVYYGNTVKYKVRVFATNGKAVGAGKYVTFKIGSTTKKVKTDKNGYATYSAKLKAGKYTITAEYAGHKVSNKITFKPTLIAKNISKKKAKTIKFTTKLVNKKGKILKNKKITFKIKGKTYKVKTNKKGIATLSLKNLKVGKYTITASYGGCKISNTITIKK